VQIKITKQLISEELISEITFASAVNNLGGKKMQKAVIGWSNREHHDDYDGSRLAHDPKLIARRVKKVKIWLLDIIPDDLTDNQKGLIVTWLARLTRDLSTGYMTSFLGEHYPGNDAWSDFEMFFHYQQFMSEKDLNKVADLEHLEEIVNAARPQIEAYQEKQSYMDAEEGTEVFRDDEEWYIAALHNKGAACEFGKGTDWCTAAPGLNYFEEYYEEDDPLFFFQKRTNDERWQFHYGSDQFMDEDDHPISKDETGLLHDLLMQTDAPTKYPILRSVDARFKVMNRSTSAADLHALLDSEGMDYGRAIAIAAHPGAGDETLKVLMDMDPVKEGWIAVYLPGHSPAAHGTKLKQSIAENPHASPEILERLMRLMRVAEEEFVKNKQDADRTRPLRGSTREYYRAIYKAIVYNLNVSTETLRDLYAYYKETSGVRGTFMLLVIGEKIRAREEEGRNLTQVALEDYAFSQTKLPPSNENLLARWKNIIN